MKKKILAMILTVLTVVSLTALTVGAFAAPMPEDPTALIGTEMQDFTVETIDGEEFSLSKELKDHDMVLINLWATWCPPCAKEFPFMQEAYEKYKDRVSIIALSVEPTDTVDVLKEYVEKNNMTFAVGSDKEPDLGSVFVTIGIPTTVVVDRFGNIAQVDVGMKASTEEFTDMFDHFLSEDYTKTESFVEK